MNSLQPASIAVTCRYTDNLVWAEHSSSCVTWICVRAYVLVYCVMHLCHLQIYRSFGVSWACIFVYVCVCYMYLCPCLCACVCVMHLRVCVCVTCICVRACVLVLCIFVWRRDRERERCMGTLWDECITTRRTRMATTTTRITTRRTRITTRRTRMATWDRASFRFQLSWAKLLDLKIFLANF